MFSRSVAKTRAEDGHVWGLGWGGYLGGYHAGFSEQVLAWDLGRGELPRQPRAGGEWGLRPRGHPLRELRWRVGPLGAAEAQGHSWRLQKHLEAQQEWL